jgi:hypothetical protein
MLVGDAVLAQHDLGVDARIVEAAEHLDDAARRRSAGAGPALHLHGDHVAVGRRQQIGGCHSHLGVESRVEGHDDGAAPLQAQLPDDLCTTPFEDLENRPLGAAVRPPPLDPRGDAVAMHRPGTGALGNE